MSTILLGISQLSHLFVYGTDLMCLASENAAELAVHQHVGEQDHVARMRVSTALHGISQLSHLFVYRY